MITRIISYGGNTFAPDYSVGHVLGTEPRLPNANVQTLQRIGAWPVIASLQRQQHSMALMIRIEGDDYDALRSQLFRWFDPDNEEPQTLIAENHDGIPMYVEAVCDDLRVYGAQEFDTAFVVTLVVHGDVRWRAVTETSDTWSITASGQTNVVANGGEDDAYPVFEITPTGGKTGGYDWRRYVLVTWRAINAGSNYPTQIAGLDTATHVVAGEMLASGNDLRVFVDGVEVARYLINMNTASTDIWFSADWQRAPQLELTADIAATGTIASIDLDDASEMNLMTTRGFVRIDNEVFSYSGRDLTNARLTGIQREAWDTDEAAHSAGADVHWMQHEVLLLYGDDTASAPSYPARHQPVFELDHRSHNGEWHYETFDTTIPVQRPGSWLWEGSIKPTGQGGLYTQTLRTFGIPWNVMGMWMDEQHWQFYGWRLNHPCGIVNAAWANGQRYAVNVAAQDWIGRLHYKVREEHARPQALIGTPSDDETWEPWSEAAAPSPWEPADYILIVLWPVLADIEVGTVTVTLNNDEVPQIEVGAHLGNYALAATITNNTTGEALTVNFQMATNETLEIDTDERTATYELDGSSQFQAIELDSVRRYWLRLQPGDNELQFDDPGTNAVTVVTIFEERYY